MDRQIQFVAMGMRLLRCILRRGDMVLRYLVLCLVLTLPACGPKLEVVQEGLTEYQVYWDPTHDRQVPHGYYKSFYENGAPHMIGQYEHGNRVGMWTEWYESGQKKGDMDWVDGKPEGVVTEWYENGQMKNRGTWKEGGRHGQSTWWYDTGIKEKEVTYVDGEPNGVWTYWDSTGAVSKKQYWDHGKFLRVEDREGSRTAPP